MEGAREALVNDFPLDEHRELLVDVIDDHRLGQAGNPERFRGDERQWQRICAKRLLDVGKQALRAAAGLEHIRDDEDLRTRAVDLLKEHLREHGKQC